MAELNLEAPWYRYRKWLAALFELDPEITVGEVQDVHDDDSVADYRIEIQVSNPEKLSALSQVLERDTVFGNVLLTVVLRGTSDSGELLPLYETVFTGNPIVKDVRDVVDPAGVHRGYVRFQPEIIQFHDDNLADYNGNWTGLAQDIADAVFTQSRAGVYFCTADKREN